MPCRDGPEGWDRSETSSQWSADDGVSGECGHPRRHDRETRGRARPHRRADRARFGSSRCVRPDRPGASDAGAAPTPDPRSPPARAYFIASSSRPQRLEPVRRPAVQLGDDLAVRAAAARRAGRHGTAGGSGTTRVRDRAARGGGSRRSIDSSVRADPDRSRTASQSGPLRRSRIEVRVRKRCRSLDRRPKHLGADVVDDEPVLAGEADRWDAGSPLLLTGQRREVEADGPALGRRR